MKSTGTESQDGEARLNDFYGSNYYEGQVAGALQSARIVLAVLFDLYRPDSVFDVGCGQGGWLAAAEELGASRISGVDGPWVDSNKLVSKAIEFKAVDLETHFMPTEKFDLAISVEVAEHLSASRAKTFVKTLCAASDVVLFSAAIPQQGGVNHVNEQWQSFWAEMFSTDGFECFDLFRRNLWNDKRVESWYRQNLLLYVRRSHPLCENLRPYLANPHSLDIVHPEIYEGNLETFRRQIENPSFRSCFHTITRWFTRKLGF